jgi:predicted Zn finger-like uncharacterized protein
MNVSCPECHSVFRVDPARVPGPGIRARCSVCGGIIPITATRSWTDDFATPHDAASLLTSQRGAGRAAVGAAALAEPGTRGASTPLGGQQGGAPPAMSRPVTPTRVPPFAPVRRPTPPAPPSVSPLAATPAPVAPSQSAPPPAQTAPRQAAASSSASPVAASLQSTSPQPPRLPEVPIGAPLSRPHAAPPSAQSVVASAPSPREPAPPSRPNVRAPEQPLASRAPAEAGPGGKAPINPFLANDPNQKAKRLARALVSDMVAYHPQKRDEGMRAGTLKQLFREEIKKSYEEYVEQIGKEFAESTSHFQDALNDVLAGGKKVF